MDTGARLTARVSGFYSTRDADFVYRGMDPADNLLELHRVASGPTEREWTFNGSWRRPLWGKHALAAGWEFGRKGRNEYRRERQLDAGGALLLASDEHYRATVARGAWFIQDEWDIDAAWSAYVGLRHEDAWLASDIGPRRQLDLYAVWKRDAQSRPRLSVSDLLHQDSRERLAYDNGSPLARTTVCSLRPVWRVMWEQSL